MLQPAETRSCIACGKTVKGRSDKKFCDDYCRASHNNELKSATTNYIRNVNNALSKNRRILESLFSGKEEMTKTTREKLLMLGFLFKYHTHFYTNKKGTVYHFCYEYGYLALENDWFLLVRRKEDHPSGH